MLKCEQTCLVLIDVQEKLLPVIDGAAELLPQWQRLVAGARLLGVPIVVTEQIPEKLGPTVAALRESLGESAPLVKSSFSAWGDAAFPERLRDLGRVDILLAGIETHVCVYQTARDLLAAGYRVQVVADAVGSRSPRNREIALQRMASDGAVWTSVEMCLLEMTGRAGTDLFRQMLKVIR